jgi:chaperonin GroEL (HSP60 family)
MTAKLATGDDRTWADVEEAGALRDGSNLLHSASDKPQLGSTQFGCGYLSPYFVTDSERMKVVFEDVYIFIHEKRLSSKSDLIPLLEQITKSGKPLLIIAEDVGGEALATLVVNKLRGPLQVAAVRAPGSGDQRKSMLQDIAFLTGCKFITEDFETQLRNIQISDLGQAKKITIDKNCTVIEGRTKYDRSLQENPRRRSSVMSDYIEIQLEPASRLR